MKKKLIGLIGIVLTALVLGSQIAPFNVKANTEIEYTMATDSDFSGTSDGSFKYIGSDEYVEIPHIIKGVNVTSYYYMFSGTSVKGVKSTNKNITNMGSMFINSRATSLDLSNLDTSSVTNMRYMFSYSQATSLDLSSFDTSSVTDMTCMFYNNQATNLDLSNFDTSSVTNMYEMFEGSQATELDLSSFDTSNVTDMSQMFVESQATKLDLSSFDTSNVTRMDYMFQDSQATALDLSRFDTSNVTEMYNMFYNSQAKELDVSNFDTSSVTGMNYMFYDSQATALDLSSFDMSNVNSMWSMFSGANATIGYARTKQDADILNASGTTGKPAGLLFVVRDPTAPTAQTNHEVDVTILPGEFSLEVPEIWEGFGSVELKANIQTLNASFGAPFTVKDLRGTQEGWRLEVQADPFTNGTHTLPASSLTIKPVANIVRVGSGSGDLPTPLQTVDKPIDEGSAVGLVSAPKGSGMGVFDITLPADALAVTVDPTIARTGVYTAMLNWSLVQAP